MKKILFASVFAFIGTFAMANETTSTKENQKKEEGIKSEKAETVDSFAPCSWWVEIPHCNTYWLCMDHYMQEDGGGVNWGQFGQAIEYFDEQKPC